MPLVRGRLPGRKNTELLSKSILSSECARFSVIDVEMGNNAFKPVDG